MLTVVLLGYTPTAVAANVQATWSPVQQATGYKVYVRQAGQPYGIGLDAGAPVPGSDGFLRFVVVGIAIDVTNFFAVVAYSSSGAESARSNELSLTIPATATATQPPTPTQTASATPTSTPNFPPANTATKPVPTTPTNSPTRTPTVTAVAILPMPTATPIPAVAFWRFEDGGGSLVSDSSGFGNAGVAENGMGWGSGRIGGGGIFDGSGAQVHVANSASLNTFGAGLTLAAWVKPTAVDSYRVLVHKEQQYSLTIANGQLSYADSATWSYATIGSFGSVPIGVWSHVAVTFDGTTLRFYVNGVEVGTKVRPGNLIPTSNPLYLAAYNGIGFRFAGTLDDVAVYSRALSTGEIVTSYSAILPPTPTRTFAPTSTATPTPIPTLTLTPTPTPTATPIPAVAFWRFEDGGGTLVSDSSGFGNAGVAENGMGWGSGRIGGGGIFDGSGAQVHVANSASLNTFGAGLTLAAWVKPTAVDSYRVLVHKEQQYSLVLSNGQLSYADSLTWSYAAIGSFGSVPIGVWSHVAVTFDGTTLRFYVNGVEVGTKVRPGNLIPTSNPLYLAAYNGIAFRFAGTLDDVAVYSRALSAAEIRAQSG